MEDKEIVKKTQLKEPFLFIFISLAIFLPVMNYMGFSNFFKTLMTTAHDLLLNTVFFIMAVAVLTSAFGNVLSEFGVVYLLNKFLSKLMKPLYNLPGASALGILTTYLSDNPAILSLAQDKQFTKYFEKWQIPLLCNLGTSFGMGLIVTTFMIAQSSAIGENLFFPVLLGNLGAIFGSIISVRIFSHYTKKYYKGSKHIDHPEDIEYWNATKGSVISRLIDGLLEGGKVGVDLGLSIIPGVLIISTIVMMFTNGPKDPSIGYQGLPYEGVPILQWIGAKLDFILNFLFGFKSPKLIAFPLTSLGSTGAALALIPRFIETKSISPNDIAVLTAIGMTWSGYLSTHIAMMDSLKARKLASKAILSHTIAGIIAGFITHLLYVLFF
ncbi:membrane protein [Marinitoga arctica]